MPSSTERIANELVVDGVSVGLGTWSTANTAGVSMHSIFSSSLSMAFHFADPPHRLTVDHSSCLFKSSACTAESSQSAGDTYVLHLHNRQNKWEPIWDPITTLVGPVIFQRAVCDVMALNRDSCAFTGALQPVDGVTIDSDSSFS